MKMTGYDDNNKMMALPDSPDIYYSLASRKFSHIREIYYMPDEYEVSGGVVRGDFALLRAFLSDHDRQLTVRICKGQAPSFDEIVLFFPDYLYGFVEDTFARAIHHKIEGSGFVLRECVGKYELRIREYDRLFSKVADDDMISAFKMCFCRLLYPVDITDSDRDRMEAFIRNREGSVIDFLAGEFRQGDAGLEYLLDRDMLSIQAVDEALPRLSDTAHAQMVAMLLGYRNKKHRRKRLVL